MVSEVWNGTPELSTDSGISGREPVATTIRSAVLRNTPTAQLTGLLRGIEVGTTLQLRTERLEPSRHLIHGVTRGDAVEIQRDGRVLAKTVALEMKVSQADLLVQHLPDLRLGRWSFHPSLRAESPQIEQRLQGQVQRATIGRFQYAEHLDQFLDVLAQ